MSQYKYDYFIAGRWRNRKAIESVLDKIRQAGKTAYCFIENAYSGDNITIDTSPEADVDEFMTQLEKVGDWQTNPTFRQIFENDMNGIRESREFILVFPAGLSAHMELGAAYGMKKKCWAIGVTDKYETLYLMLERIFPDAESFIGAKVKQAV